MSNNNLFIPIILGTIRQGRKSEKVAKFLHAKLEAHPEIDTQLFDLRDFNLSTDDAGQALKFDNPEYRNAIVKADGLLIVTPEYNRIMPGELIRGLDVLLTEYTHRAVALAGVSSGSFGGARVIENSLSYLRELGLVATHADLFFGSVGSLFDDDGNITDEAYHSRVDSALEELIWMAKALRWGRENLPSKYDKKLKELEAEWQEKTN